MESPWKILLLDTKRQNPNHYLCLALESALRRCSGVEHVAKVQYGNAVQTALQAANGFNLFLAFDGEDMEEAVCARLAKLCGRSILWVTEDPYELRTNLRTTRHFDLTLTNDLASVGSYQGRARHLPLAADREMHYQAIQEPHPYLYDVFFAGTAWPNRVTLLRALTTRMTDVKFKVALPTNPYLPHPEIGQPKAAFNWRTPSPEFCRMANRSRITLSLHREFSASDNPAQASTPGPRLFEVALAGGFQLADHRLEELTAYYRPGEHYDTFRDAEDCEEKIREYLHDTPRREAMARATQAETLTRHLYDHRAATLLQFAAEIPEAAPSVITERTRKPNLLFVAHNTVAGAVFGGVEVVMKILSEGLRERYNIFCYVPVNQNNRSLGAILYGPDLIELRRFDFPTIESNSHLSCPFREQTFAQVLNEYAIELVHYHHLIGHVPSLPLISKAYGIPATLTVYDYFPVCTNFNLLDYDRKFCRIEDRAPVACDICLNAMYNFPRGSQGRRRTFQERALDACDALIFISQDTLNRCVKLLPNARLPEKSLVIDLPVAYEQPANHDAPLRWQKPYKIVSFGNFTHAKGADIMLRAFDQVRDLPFEFHLYGRLDEPYTSIVGTLGLPNVRIQRQFAPGSLQAALEDAALSLHISIWPETFCITVAEAMHFGVVPIVSDVGAPDERITHGVNGFKIAADDPAALVDLLRQIADDPGLLQTCHQNVRRHRVHLPSDHVQAMANHYAGLLRKEKVAPLPTGLAPAGLTLADCGIVLEQVSWCGLPTLGFEAEGVGKPKATQAPSSREVTDALLTEAPEQSDFKHDDAGHPRKHQGALALYSPVYIAERFVRQQRQHGWAYTLNWHVNTVKKLFGGGRR